MLNANKLAGSSRRLFNLRVAPEVSSKRKAGVSCQFSNGAGETGAFTGRTGAVKSKNKKDTPL